MRYLLAALFALVALLASRAHAQETVPPPATPESPPPEPLSATPESPTPHVTLPPPGAYGAVFHQHEPGVGIYARGRAPRNRRVKAMVGMGLFLGGLVAGGVLAGCAEAFYQAYEWVWYVGFTGFAIVSGVLAVVGTVLWIANATAAPPRLGELALLRW